MAEEIKEKLTKKEALKIAKRFVYETNRTEILAMYDQVKDKSVFNRKHVTRQIHIDVDDLFNKHVSETVAFLKTLPQDSMILQKWYDYEANYFAYTIDDLENDSEYGWRVRDILVQAYIDSKKVKEEKERQSKIKQLEKELADLKGKAKRADSVKG